MADIIDILVVVQAQSIMNRITDNKIENNMNVDNPIFLAHDYGFNSDDRYINMLTPVNIHYVSGQGTDGLGIKANINDIVRWRGVTLSKDSEYSAALLKLSPAATTTEEEANKYFTAPEVIPVHSYAPALKTDNPIIYPNPVDVVLQPTENYYWETSVKRMPDHGQYFKGYYAFTVGIYKNGYPQAYVFWDPTISLNSM
ncbi:AidA/PixA family protein [Xenorhabdus budapestensis]|uniref:AidA/PixA family protein n=1 Tax=Xenorhabdus budapestensis TaxID=290110 RepID=UPI003A84D6EE